MRFEHILQIYWSKGFFFAGKLFYFDKLYYQNIFKYHLFGFSSKLRRLLLKRLELTTFSFFYKNLYYLVDYSINFFKKMIKTINIIFSQLNNINLSLKELKKLNIIRMYLIKSYKGYCHSIGKPVRGQRTWSNSWNSYKYNTLLRNFISKTRNIIVFSGKNYLSGKNFRTIKKKYTNERNIKVRGFTWSGDKPSTLKKLWF
jgi:ribosomal protein S13